MLIKTVAALTKSKEREVLFLPFFEKNIPAFSSKGIELLFKAPLESGDFSGKKGEALCHYPSKGEVKRVVLLGLGSEKEVTKETLRNVYAKGVRLVKEHVKTGDILPPSTTALPKKEIEEAVTEGVLLANYVFDKNKSEKDKAIEEFTFIGGFSEKAVTACKGIFLARDLIMDNADRVLPHYLANQAKHLATQFPTIKTKVLGRKEIVKEKLGLLEAVSKGATAEPALIFIEYKGAPKSKEISAIVGKGVTYDTGGLNLKPTGGMETMRDDMSGAAAVLATLQTIATLKLPVNVVGVIGSTENAIGPDSYKPGDVYVSHKGLKVEIANTDAEGRLVLADAISYAQEKYPLKRIIDLATLTGGAIIALGEEVSALMSNDDELARELFVAGEETYERVWRLPLYEEYEKLLKSKYADLKNVGIRQASSIQGGMFIQRFVKKGTAWAHLDIAGTAFPNELKSYQPVQAAGVGVRLLTTFFENLCK